MDRSASVMDSRPQVRMSAEVFFSAAPGTKPHPHVRIPIPHLLFSCLDSKPHVRFEVRIAEPGIRTCGPG